MASKQSRADKRCLTACFVKPWRIFPLVFQTKLFKIEPLLFLYMFSRLFYTPLYEQYFFNRFGSDLLQKTSFPFPNGSFCLDSSLIDEYYGKDGHKIVVTDCNHLLLYAQLAVRIPGMITILVLGPLSDRFGRKPVLIFSLVGNLLQGMVAVAIVYFNLSLYYFILASFLAGIGGDFSGLLAGAFSYIADVSSLKRRTFRIGIVQSMIAIGGAFGQFIIGYWLKQVNCYFLPLMGFNTACVLAALLWVIFFIPESLTRKERQKRFAKKPSGPRALLQGLKMFSCLVPQYSTWKLWAAMVMINLPLFNAEGNILISVFFLKAPPFDVDATIIGIYQSIASVSRAIGNTLVLFSFSVALRMPDGASAFVAISFQLAANILLGFAKTEIQIYFIAIVLGREAISYSAGRSLMSKLVAKEDQGALFSVVASLQSCVYLLASVLWPLFYPMTLQSDNLPTGFIFWMMAAVDLLAYPLLIPLIISEVLQRRKGKRVGRLSHGNETDKLLADESLPNYASINGVTRVNRKYSVLPASGDTGSIN